MGECVRQMCLLAVLFGVILNITPDGNVKRVSGIVCSAALIMTLLSGVRGLDLPQYVVEAERYRQLGDELSASAEKSADRISRLVIESECEEYIMDKATVLGIVDIRVEVTAHRDDSGEWLPGVVILVAQCSDEAKERLCDIIETEMGIGKGNQIWSN